jgi:hypothetical protein
MNAAEFVREGRALARPCVYLRAVGTEYAGFWPTTDGRRRRHWLTFDSRYLPMTGGERQGLISVFTDDEDGGSVARDREGTLPERPDGLKLFASRSISLPPLDAVFRYGSPAVHNWLSALGWDPRWGVPPSFPGRAVTDEYERLYQRHR